MSSKALSEEELGDLLSSDITSGMQRFGLKHDLTYLLLFLEQGVVWGVLRSGELMLGNKLPLDWSRVQQAHLFNREKELRLWRVGDKICGAWLKGDSEENAIIEDYYLFGKAVPEKEGFSLLNDGKKNEIQLVPLKLNKSESVVLKVCHVLNVDDDGQCYIHQSRLMDLVKKAGV